MDYIVRVTTRTVYTRKDETKCMHHGYEYLRCKSITMADKIASALGAVYSCNTLIEIGVKIWNGKGSTFVPLSTIEQVYAEMTVPNTGADDDIGEDWSKAAE